MATLSISAAVRSVLSTNLDMPADEVIKKVQAKGVKAPADSIRKLVHNIKSDVRKAAKPAPAGAGETAAPALATSAVPAAPDVSGVLANVTLVNEVAGVAGGVDQARQV